MIDPVLIFFVVLAAFLSYRLFSVLGTRGGHEPDEQDRIQTAPTRPQPVETPDEPMRPVEPRNEPAWAKQVREHKPNFVHTTFLDGAKAAYEMIVQAYAKGTLEDVRPYIDPGVMRTFEAAVEGRRNANQSMEVTFVGIENADVEHVSVVGEHLEILIGFKSDQIRLVRDSDGNVVDGDPNRIDLVRDRWTFSQPIDSRDPNWILTATDGAAPTLN